MTLCAPSATRVSGPHTPTSAPSFNSPQMLERATRECWMSPTRQTFSPAIVPCRSRIVSRSSSAWVGCSCVPSPALTTLERMRLPRNRAAPDDGWRITTMSIRIASRFFAVSTSVSPFCTALPDAATFTVSADRRFSANSKEMRVRVEASKNRLTIVLPRSAGTFLMGRSDPSLNGSAVSRMRRIWSGERLSSPTRSLPSGAVTPGLPGAPSPPRRVRRAPAPARPPARHGPLSPACRRRRAGSAARDRRGRRARTGRSLRASEVRELVEGGPHGAAGIQHIVHDHDVFAGEVAWNTGLADHGLRADGLEVVAIQRDVEGAAGNGHALVFLDQPGDPLGELDAAALDADQDQVVGPVGQLEHLHGHTLKRPRQGAGVQDGGPFGPAHLEPGS